MSDSISPADLKSVPAEQNIMERLARIEQRLAVIENNVPGVEDLSEICDTFHGNVIQTRGQYGIPTQDYPVHAWVSDAADITGNLTNIYQTYGSTVSLVQNVIFLDAVQGSDDRGLIYLQAGYKSPQDVPFVKLVLDNGDIAAGGFTAANITLNDRHDDVDTLIYDDAGNVALQVDAGTGQTIVRQLGRIAVIGDDSNYYFAPPFSAGLLAVQGGSDTTVAALLEYKCQAGAVSLSDIGTRGANLNLTTGILYGTTGTDGKLTISVHTDGNIYVENRRGGTRNIRLVLLV